MLADGANRGTGAFIPLGASPVTTWPPGTSMPALGGRAAFGLRRVYSLCRPHSHTGGAWSLAVVPVWVRRPVAVDYSVPHGIAAARPRPGGAWQNPGSDLPIVYMIVRHLLALLILLLRRDVSEEAEQLALRRENIVLRRAPRVARTADQRRRRPMRRSSPVTTARQAVMSSSGTGPG